MYNWSIMGLSDLVIGQSVFWCRRPNILLWFAAETWSWTSAGGSGAAGVAAEPEDDTTGPWWLFLTAVFIFRKSTFFNVLTKSQAAAENFPFCTIDPNESRVPIPDQRYDFLCRFHKPARYEGVTPFTNHSHVSSVILDDLLAAAVWKDVAMLLTCSCCVFLLFFFVWCFSGKEKWRHQKLQHLVIIHIYGLLKQFEFRFARLYGQITRNVSIFDRQISTSNTKHAKFHCMLSPQHLGSCWHCLSFLHFVSSKYE